MDNQVALYISLNWLTVLCYVAATIANVSGIIFGKAVIEKRSYWPVWLGLAIHSVAIVYWWSIVGHGPYMAPSEVLSSDAWITMVVFLIFLRFFPRIRPASVVVFPMVFLLIALAIFYNPGIRSLPPTFGSIWLVLHIAFYKIALGTLIIALAFSIFFLLKSRSALPVWLQRLPDLESIDLHASRFAGFGFIFWGIGMLAGSIWAYKSWGRFWGWDPVETWSLITWLLFGVYLHLRRFFRMSGCSAAWLFIVCFIMSLVSLFVTSHMGSSIHAEYFQ
ncbi:MAG: cytochrome C biogenesis protein ResC [Geobacteraceae bacterium GWB2_52_12]|nr:MAG: cytochrome C biogenesis protein ResC [Geobacteraceae bacterium GWB2_52_12]